ncbi:MAG: NAD-dependent epimerase/dehydratase family protein [Gemmatimonadales bacterium]
MTSSLDARDLTHVLDNAHLDWTDLRGARVLITGVTGFVGSWLLETLVHANEALGLDVHVTALVRDRAAFTTRFPHLAAAKAVRIHVGDVRIVDPPTHAFTHYVHCASASPPKMNAERPAEVVDVIERGTERMLEEAESAKGARFLQVSSGSVYGTVPPAVALVDEDFDGRADAADPAQRFGAAKWRAEQRGAAAVERGVGFVAARVFALLGPRLPLDGQFAIGNFLGDALAGRTIRLSSDGTPVRSWMHAADMAAWCWTLLVRGRVGAAYNVGSEEALTIWDAANLVAALRTPPVSVERAGAAGPGQSSNRYVPSTRRAREEFGLECRIPFDDALRRTWDWLQRDSA